MCLGIPMQVIESGEFTALCVGREGVGRGEERRVSTMLVGEQPVGTWLVVHIDSAIRVIDAEEAALIGEALDALASVLKGLVAEDGVDEAL